MTSAQSITIPSHARFPLLLIGITAVLAWAIVNGTWIVVLVAIAVPLLILAPVEMSLGLFALVVPFDSVATLNGEGTTLNWILGAITATVLLAKGFLSGRLQRPPRTAWWWISFLGWCSISAIWALQHDIALHRLVTAASLIGMYFVAVSFQATRQELLHVAYMAVLGAAAAACYVAIRFHGHGLPTRASLGDTDPNHFAASLLLPLALTFGISLASRLRAVKLAMMLALMCMAFSLFTSMSRGALVATLVMVFVFAIRLKQQRRILLILCAFAAVPLLLMPDLFFQRVQHSVAGRAAGRFDIWYVGWAMFKDHGLFGVGLNNFKVAYTQYSGLAPIFRGYVRVAHNILLQIAVEMGIVGVALFGSAVLAEFKAVRRVWQSAVLAEPTLVAYEAACWATLAMGFSIDNLWRKYFWLAFILLSMSIRTFWKDFAAAHDAQQQYKQA